MGLNYNTSITENSSCTKLNLTQNCYALSPLTWILNPLTILFSK